MAQRLQIIGPKNIRCKKSITFPFQGLQLFPTLSWRGKLKRLTDTDKWKNPWFRKLPTKYKVLFLFMLDTCDNAGVMHIDFELFNFSLKEEFFESEFKDHFKEKIVYIAPDKIIIKNYIRYQHGSNANEGTMAKHVKKVIDTHGIGNLVRNQNIWEGYR